jgi:hypothetical protein
MLSNGNLDQKHCLLQVWDLRTGAPKKIAGFVICGLAHLGNLRICDCGYDPMKRLRAHLW